MAECATIALDSRDDELMEAWRAEQPASATDNGASTEPVGATAG